jgi:NADPH:quinone reductase-like Zn-dependent oxidoreductase
MERLARFMEEGSVTPAVGRRYRLEQAAEAIADLEAGRTRGKSVIVVEGE